LKKSYKIDFVDTLDRKYHSSLQESVERLQVSDYTHQRSLDTLRNNLNQISTQFKSSNQEYEGDLSRLSDKYQQEMDNVM